MSRVFEAEETGLGRRIVLKVLPPDLAAGVSVERFRREIQLAASLQHPHIVPLLAAGEADGLLYYTMPFVEGESLRHRLQREGELPVADAARILREVADALAYAHHRGLVHRDIKPENVLLSGAHAMVTDFGIAKAVAERSGGDQSVTGLTSAGFAVGTPVYMAPEQSAGDPSVDQRTDLYALGVMAYEILTGHLPFEGRSAQQLAVAHMTQAPEEISRRRPGVPAQLGALVMRLLAKRPADRPQTADEVVRVLGEIVTPSGETVVVASGGARVSAARSRRLWWGAAGVAAVVALGLVIGKLRRGPAPALDENLVAVAPFDVLDQRFAVWHEGLVDVLSRDLDGAGPLRIVAPSMVVSRWRGRADAPSAQALGQSTGAGLVVFGSVVGTGRDSVRINAAIADARTARQLGEVDRRGAADRIDQLVDTVAVSLLNELNRTRSIGAFRIAGLGAKSLPALKSFLQGEQLYRRADYDSALVHYRRAVELDSTFPLALRRTSEAIGWSANPYDSLATIYGLRAGALNRGLSPRDSLLTAADSQIYGLFNLSTNGDSGFRALQRRLFQTLATATTRYPTDPEAWYMLGDARQHFGFGGDLESSPRQTLETFDRAIALDSTFAPAYEHPVGLALELDDPAAARRYARAMLRHSGSGAPGVRLVLAAVENDSHPVPDLDRMFDSASSQALTDVHLAFWNVPDSAETALRAVRALARGGHGGWIYGTDSLFTANALRAWLAARGHLHEACRDFDPSQLRWVARSAYRDCGLMGGMSADSFASTLNSWLAALGKSPSATAAVYASLDWWNGRRDTTAIAQVVRRSEALARTGDRPMRQLIALGTPIAQAYLALARGDSADALRRFAAIPDTLCNAGWCDAYHLTFATLRSARGDDRGAMALLERRASRAGSSASWVLTRLARARVRERLHQRDDAIGDYRYVATAWRKGDPEVQPYVAEAKAALARLAAEPR